MMKYRLKLFSALCACVTCFAGFDAWAQEAQNMAGLEQSGIQNVENVEGFGFRTRFFYGAQESNFDPFSYRGEPVKFGSFLLYPNLALKQGFNDNVLATEDDERSDFVTVFAPELVVQKSVGRHDFVLQLQNETTRHWDETNDNTEDYHARFQGNLEAKQGINIPFEVAYSNGFLDRRDQRRANVNQVTRKPLQNSSFVSEAGIIYKPNRLSLGLIGGYRIGRLENEETFAGNLLIRDNRDVTVHQVQTRVGYDTLAGLEPFIELTYADEDFTNERAGADSRDNELYRILAGASFDYRGLLKGYLGIGHDTRDYSDPDVSKVNSVSIDGRATWEPTAKTKLSASASRATFEDNVIAAGLTETTFGLEGRHELMRDTFGRAFIAYDHDEFEDIDRTDKTTELGGELLYIIGPHLQIGAEYTFTNRDSNVDGLGLNNSVVFLKAKLAL